MPIDHIKIMRGMKELERSLRDTINGISEMQRIVEDCKPTEHRQMARDLEAMKNAAMNVLEAMGLDGEE